MSRKTVETTNDKHYNIGKQKMKPPPKLNIPSHLHIVRYKIPAKQKSTSKLKLSNVGPFGCVKCNRRFKTKQSLYNHMRDCGKLIRCLIPQCGALLKGDTSFKDHMDRHYNYKRYKCKICNRRFYRSGWYSHPHYKQMKVSKTKIS